MKLHIPHVVIVMCIIPACTSNDSIKEICDVEGTEVEDCPVEVYCCNPLKCNATFHGNNKQNSYTDVEDEVKFEGFNKRCCNSFERNSDSKPSNCKICKVCCDEVERKTHPLPKHCSKCNKCEYSENRGTLQEEIFKTETVQRTG